MPITFRARDRSAERLYQAALDWARKLMQLSVVATVVLYGYLLYGLFLGDVGNWGSLQPAAKLRIDANVSSAILALNISIGILLASLCVLYYDEESLPYALIALAVVLYYGVPFALEQAAPGQLAEWERTGNRGALGILQQFRAAALMMAVPGGILLIRDLFLRVTDAARRNKEEFRTMQYGGAVKEEAPIRSAPIGLLAKCWQLPFCREAVRKRCPIYHARTRCWRERVGCMCEENVIRHAMDALINKELVTLGPKPDAVDFSSGAAAQEEQTKELPRRAEAPPLTPKKVKIPHNPNLPMAAKIERCRNCVIYNEHQRLKYQFFAPLFVIAVPALAYWNIDAIAGTLNHLLRKVDQVMANLTLTAEPGPRGIVTSLTSTSQVAEYVVIGSLVVIATTMVLRGLEYAIFKLKI